MKVRFSNLIIPWLAPGTRAGPPGPPGKKPDLVSWTEKWIDCSDHQKKLNFLHDIVEMNSKVCYIELTESIV